MFYTTLYNVVWTRLFLIRSGRKFAHYPMIKKVTIEQLRELINGVYKPATSSYYNGMWYEKLSEGKITLSIKKGKKRILLKGYIRCVGYESSRTSSGYNILKFTTRQEKINVLL